MCLCFCPLLVFALVSDFVAFVSSVRVQSLSNMTQCPAEVVCVEIGKVWLPGQYCAAAWICRLTGEDGSRKSLGKREKHKRQRPAHGQLRSVDLAALEIWRCHVAETAVIRSASTQYTPAFYFHLSLSGFGQVEPAGRDGRDDRAPSQCVIRHRILSDPFSDLNVHIVVNKKT